MENLAVLQGLGTKKPKLIGYYKPSFLTTSTLLALVPELTEKSRWTAGLGWKSEVAFKASCPCLPRWVSWFADFECVEKCSVVSVERSVRSLEASLEAWLQLDNIARVDEMHIPRPCFALVSVAFYQVLFLFGSF